MKVFLLCSFVFSAGLVLSTGQAEAEQRVLLSFDHAGHKVIRIVRLDTSAAPLEPSVVVKHEKLRNVSDIDLGTLAVPSGQVQIVWVDELGNVHAQTNEADPRITHSPSHIEGLDNSRQSLGAGAWLVSGPQRATRLIMLMPENPSIGLPAERWDIELTQ